MADPGPNPAAQASTTDGAIQPKTFSFNVLQLIKTGQSQHGCRYGDYQRYRRYCCSRLRRLYKSLKFLHGRGKYAKKALDPSMVTDVRHLHIPLYLAERAWGYAMELKQVEAGTRHFSAKRKHMLSRLTRAARWADAFARLCQERGDSKTALEAEAYASYMWGSLLVEKEQDFEAALAKLLRARAVYEQLGHVGEVEEQVLCRQRAEEMEPSIRFCNYKLGRTDSASMLSLSGEEGPGGLLQSKLEAVLEEARSQQAASMTELEWLGRKLPVLNAKTRICILKAQQLEAEALAPETTNERKLNLFDKIFAAYHDAKRHIREDLVAAGSAEDVKEQLSALDRAVSCLLLQRTLDRNSVLVHAAQQRLARAEQKQQAQADSKGVGHKRQKLGPAEDVEGQEQLQQQHKEKPAKPEDLIRLYDTLIQNLGDLADLTSSGRELSAQERSFTEQLEKRKVACEAARCTYVGLAYAYSSPPKPAEASAILGLAATKIESALSALKDADSLESLKAELEALLLRCRGQRATLRAQAALDAIKGKAVVEEGVANMVLSPRSKQAQAQRDKDPADSQYLLQNLDKYVSVLPPEGSKQPPRIFQIPPPLCAVPCRPIVLDTALNAITFPSLEGRTQTKKATGGLFSSFFGR